MNRTVKNNPQSNNLGRIQFTSQEQILEAHQIMLNKLRENIINLAKQNSKLQNEIKKINKTLESNDIEIITEDKE